MLLTAAADSVSSDDTSLFESLVDEVCLYRTEQVRLSIALTLLQVGSTLDAGDEPADRRLARALPQAAQQVDVRFGPRGEWLLRPALTAALAHANGEHHLSYQTVQRHLADAVPANVRFETLFALVVLALQWVASDSTDVPTSIQALALALASEPQVDGPSRS